MKIQLVAAMGANRVIGNGPQIPWRIPGEQQIFRRLTEGRVIAMGRKTFESIGRPLPNRTTIVITRQPSYGTANIHLASSLDQAVAIAQELGDELIVAGGAEIYALAMPKAQRIHLTEIHQEFPGDILFPVISDLEFHRTHCEEVTASIPYSYSIYERRTYA